MKKFMAVILCIAMMLCMAACGEETGKRSSAGSATKTQNQGEAAAETQEGVENTRTAKVGEKYTVYDPVGNTKELEVQWRYNTDGTVEQIRWDSEIGERYQYAFVLNPIETDPLHLIMMEDDHRAEFTYNTDGTVSEVKVIGGGETMYLGVISYDVTNKVSSATVTSAYGDKGTLTYSYNEQDQLVEVSFSSTSLTANAYYTNDYWDGHGTKSWYVSNSFTYTYTYNADGTVATKTYLGYDLWSSEAIHSVVTEYSYDAAGHLSGAVCKRNYEIAGGVPGFSMTDNYAFTCDAQGTPISVTITCGDVTVNNSYVESSEVSKIVIESVYDVPNN